MSLPRSLSSPQRLSSPSSQEPVSLSLGGAGGSESFGGLGLWGGAGGAPERLTPSKSETPKHQGTRRGSIPAQDFKVQGNPETLKNFLMGVWMGPRAWVLEIWGLGFVGLGFRV